MSLPLPAIDALEAVNDLVATLGAGHDACRQVDPCGGTRGQHAGPQPGVAGA